VKLQRFSRIAAGLAVTALALTACGSDNNTTSSASKSSTSPQADSACATGTLNGEGSSAQKNAIEEAISGFTGQCSAATVNYNPTGSGTGVKQFNGGQVDFAGSDSALKADKGEVAAAKTRCQNNDAWNLPMVVGPIAIAYNIAGLDKLVLTPAVAAGIFTGDIKTWSDPKIAALNSGAKLPTAAIKVFFRSDESGTTENFTKYLKGASGGVWTAAPAKAWSGTGEGKAKSDGVSQGVKSTPNSVTYVEWSYAKDNQLGIAQVDNGGGPVELTGESVGKAVVAAKADGVGNDLRLKLDYTTKEAGAYPVLLVTYEIVCSKGLDATKTKLLKSFLTYFSATDTQKGLETIGYAPLPDAVRTKVDAAIKAIS
jgi:phosphate transport system substrate-binding protein